MANLNKKAITAIQLTLVNSQTLAIATTHTKEEFTRMMEEASGKENGNLVIEAVDEKPEVKDSCIILPLSRVVFVHVIVLDQSGLIIARQMPNANNRNVQ